MSDTTDHIRPLDLSRGLAAFVILLYHIQFLFLEGQTLLQNGYLCVDFFFLLSGFVIANRYEGELKSGLGVTKFCVLRIARLWPLVVLTTLLGLAVQLPRWHRDMGSVDALSLIITTLCNSFALPSPMSPNKFLFPMNGAAWSIFFEFTVNIAYALLIPVLSNAALILIIAASGVGLVFTAAANNTLDVGWAASNFVFGFPRVAFSFFIGVYIHRIEREIWGPRTFAPWLLSACLLAALVALNLPSTLFSSAKGMYDFLITALVFPALLIVAVRTRFRSWGNSAAWFLGGISYSVYLLQTPLVIGFSGVPQMLFGIKIGEFAPWAGVIFVPLCLSIAYVTWVYFEQPAQRWLRSALLGQGSARMKYGNR